MVDSELVAHVASSTGLASSDAERVIEDVLHWYAETAEIYVRRRQAELNADGTRNEAAFAVIASELRSRLVSPPAFSQRQLRRIVYG